MENLDVQASEQASRGWWYQRRARSSRYERCVQLTVASSGPPAFLIAGGAVEPVEQPLPASVNARGGYPRECCQRW